MAKFEMEGAGTGGPWKPSDCLVLLLIIALIASLVISIEARAETYHKVDPEPHTLIGFGFSHHFRDAPYNEEHDTLGYEYRFRRGPLVYGAGVGYYLNSYYHDSYAIRGFTGDCMTAYGELCYGVSYGAATGYPDTPVKPLGGFLVSYTVSGVGMEFIYTPSILWAIQGRVSIDWGNL